MLGLCAAATAGVLAAHAAKAQACNFVNPTKYALELTAVTLDGVPTDLGTNECDNTATLAVGWYTAKHLANYDLEVFTVRSADGGTVATTPPCQGLSLVSEDFAFDLAFDGGVDGG